MRIPLRPDHAARLQEIAARVGRDPSQLAQAAVDRLFAREGRRAALLADLCEADASLARGEGRALASQSRSELAEAVTLRARARLTGGGAALR